MPTLESLKGCVRYFFSPKFRKEKDDEWTNNQAPAKQKLYYKICGVLISTVIMAVSMELLVLIIISAVKANHQ